MANTGIENYAITQPNLYDEFAYGDVLSRALIGRKGTFLDLGSGDGNKLLNLLSRGLLNNFNRVIATDLSETRLKTISALAPQVEVICADASQLPFENSTVDFIFSDQVIEHVPDDAAMAREIARVLHPNGAAFVGSVIRLSGAWYFHRNAGKWRLDPTHVREYRSLNEYEMLFRNAGLRVIATDVANISFPIGHLVLRLLLRMRLLKRGQVFRFSRRLKLGSLHIPRYRNVIAILELQPQSEKATGTN